MSDQLTTEYRRLLNEYKIHLVGLGALGEIEIEAIEGAIREKVRFRVRHALLDLANHILRTDAKLSVFDNFIWDPEK